ncbi:transcriptional regulator, SarA/Rot family [Staphylococcus pettenkoferi]|uniref:transcriptional regulator, SarA/Rot family n=1 Tax=Staphylococcus pettenkoferi TaxID=170573 RepID=UPI002554EC0F|nr:hypothetical protein [Staphylococcus pettenkoferi]MDK7284309.1 hypothetical protein [Staphylococcus pettenkoferi]
MKTIKEIQLAYQDLGAIHTLDKALKKTKELAILDVLILKMASESNDFIRKSEVEKKLNVSPSMTQKSTKRLRKAGLIIKDRDIDDESIIIIGMNDEMRNKAKSLFEEVETLQETILEEKEEKEKEEKQKKDKGQQDEQEKSNEENSKENKNAHNMPNHKK